MLLVPLDLTDEEREAVLALLADEPLETTDLFRALERSLERRMENSRWGGLVVEAALRNGETLRSIAAEVRRRTGIDVTHETIRHWGEQPKRWRP